MNGLKEHISDAELLQMLAQDDRKAFEEIYNRYWSALLDSVYRRTRDIDQCKDIVQDVFVDLWKRRGTVEIENLKAYLYAAVRFQVLKLFASQKETPLFVELFETISSPQYNSDNTIYEKELDNLYNSWLQSLPEKRKKIFLMHYRDELSTREISKRLNISQKTVQNQLGIAANEMQNKLIIYAYLLLSIHELVK
jgi:RNA polymerase sigma-70 factor (family 1)